MGWNNVEIKVETIIDDNPGLYIQRIERFMELRDYDNALNECENFKKVGGREEVYTQYVKWIFNLKSGRALVVGEVEEKLKKIISESLNVSIRLLNSNTRLSDLDADSLDAFQIIMGVEEEFDIEITNEEVKKMENWNLRQISAYIDQMR